MAAGVNGSNNNSSSNGNSCENSGVVIILDGIKHNPGISTDWSPQEQSVLDDGLVKYASEINVVRYAKIAFSLPNKTVRDIALRCRWLNKKEVSRRRKENPVRKSKDKREKVNENISKPPQMAPRPVGLPHSMPVIPVDDEDCVSFEAIGGPTGELLEQNQQYFQQISTNFSSFQCMQTSFCSGLPNLQIQENISLLCQARDNVAKIMNSMSDSPEMMKQMPALPVKLNEELANSILPRISQRNQS